MKENESVEIDWKVDPQSIKTIETPEYSEWKCCLFGCEPDNGIIWRPLKGQHPNWFWRKMQYICFGNKWIKDITK